MKQYRIFVFWLLGCTLPAMCPAAAQDAGAQRIADRLRRHVEFFASDSLAGRKAGSPGEQAAADYVYRTLKCSGVTMLTSEEGQDFSIVWEGDTVRTRNVVGIVEGGDPRLREQYVVVGAALDHAGTATMTVDGRPVLQLFPGADANASGLAVLLEVADQLASAPFLLRRSVIFTAFGASELGGAGSWYQVNRAFPLIDSVSVMVDLNRVGRPESGYRYYYYTGGLNRDVAAAVDSVGLFSGYPAPFRGEGLSLSSDYLSFYERGIPAVLFTAGRHPDSGTVRDTPDRLDYPAMESLCGFVVNFVTYAAARPERMDVPGTPVPLSGDGAAVSRPEDRIYSPAEVDKAPEFFHGDERRFLEDWVYGYLRYPDRPLRDGIQGTVLVEFVVEANGQVGQVKIVRGVDEDLDREVIRVVSASPKWKAGQVGGRKVRVKYSIPVEFRLKKR